MFNGIMDFMKKMFRNEKAQGMVEYILLVVVIALVALWGFTQIGTSANSKAQEAATNITSGYVYMLR